MDLPVSLEAWDLMEERESEGLQELLACQAGKAPEETLVTLDPQALVAPLDHLVRHCSWMEEVKMVEVVVVVILTRDRLQAVSLAQ